MAATKKNYKVLKDFGMGDKQYTAGEQVELYPVHTAALLKDGAIELVEAPGETKNLSLPPSGTAIEQKASSQPAPDQSELIKKLVHDLDEMRANQDMFLQVADKKLLAQYYAKNQKKMPKEYRLNTINDKVVVLFHDMPKNEVGKNPATKVWFEDQMMEVVLEDDEVVKMTYQNWITSYKQVVAKVVSVKVDEVNEEAVAELMRVDNGKVYNINVKYLN